MTFETSLPATIEPGSLLPASHAELVPALIADAGEDAGWRYKRNDTSDQETKCGN
jgi:hypothetical protein